MVGVLEPGRKLNASRRSNRDLPTTGKVATAVAPARRSPEYLRQFVESEIAKWAAVTKAAGISAAGAAARP